jgi:beta-N-acetylhexosaminidase
VVTVRASITRSPITRSPIARRRPIASALAAGALALVGLGAGLPASAQSPSPGSTGGLASPAPSASLDPFASPAPSAQASPSAVPAASPDPRVEAAFAGLLTDEDLVGQLLLLSWNGSTPASVRDALQAFRPGGLVYVANAGRARKATRLNAAIAAVAQELGMVPPIRAIDHEGGIVQRIDDVRNLGSNGAFGRSRPTLQEACERGATHAEQLRGMGFDMSLGPVLDVATNPRNPVIGDRSYGPRPAVVARLGAAYIRGLQGGGIMGSGKHFPGHGDTAVDSHLGLPVIKAGMKRLGSVELVPFVRAMAPDTDVASIMTGHLALPRIDPSGAPASLSRPIVTGLLREQLGWQGLVLTDDMGAMDAITDRYGPGEAAVRAVEAGVDLLIIVKDGDNQEQARDALLDALRDGRLDRAQVEASVRRVLAAKARFGLLDGIRTEPVPCAEAG